MDRRQQEAARVFDEIADGAESIDGSLLTEYLVDYGLTEEDAQQLFMQMDTGGKGVK